MESTFRSISERKLINTGFLNGPFCPIYGFGAIIMFAFLEKFENNIVLLFIVAFVVLSLWEYISGVYLETVFKTKYWDYSNHKFNIKGRVCLTNSIYWGFLGTVFIKYIHPFVESRINLIDVRVLHIVIGIITIGFIIDSIVSAIKVKNIKSTLQRIEELNNQIKEKLEEINSKDYKVDIKENVHETISELKKRKNKMFRSLYKRAYRLKKAFPEIQSKEITEILNRKIEFIKKEKRRKNDTGNLYNR
jgi:uncharacterized membrane protein